MVGDVIIVQTNCWYKNQTMNMMTKQCYHCYRYKHAPYNYWYKDQRVDAVGVNDEENRLFMAIFILTKSKVIYRLLTTGAQII